MQTYLTTCGVARHPAAFDAMYPLSPERHLLTSRTCLHIVQRLGKVATLLAPRARNRQVA